MQTIQDKLLTIFDNVKPGQTVRILARGPIESHNLDDYGNLEKYTQLRVGRRTRSKKYNTDKISLINPKNPHGCKHYLYKRNGLVSMAHGDMGYQPTDIHID